MKGVIAFKGRIDRSTFFATTVLLYIFMFAFAIILAVGAGSSFSGDSDFPKGDIPASLQAVKLPTAAGWTLLVVGMLGIFACFLGTIGLSVCRLHDFGLTGFLVLFYPVLKHVIPDAGWPDWLPGPADLLWFLVMIAQPGTRGPNAFGPDPREPDPPPAGEPIG